LFAPQNERSLIIQILALVTNKVTNKTIKLLLSLKSRMTSPRHEQTFGSNELGFGFVQILVAT
jgi:hypothetical protein